MTAIAATSSAPASTASPDSKPPSAANPVAASNTIVAPPNPWETLRVGARVLAAYWNEKREFEGFWLATVKRIDKGEFTLRMVSGARIPGIQEPPQKYCRAPSRIPRLGQVAPGCGFNPQRRIGAAFGPPLLVPRAPATSERHPIPQT